MFEHPISGLPKKVDEPVAGLPNYFNGTRPMGNCPTCQQYKHLTLNSQGVATCHDCKVDTTDFPLPTPQCNCDGGDCEVCQ